MCFLKFQKQPKDTLSIRNILIKLWFKKNFNNNKEHAKR